MHELADRTLFSEELQLRQTDNELHVRHSELHWSQITVLLSKYPVMQGQLLLVVFESRKDDAGQLMQEEELFDEQF